MERRVLISHAKDDPEWAPDQVEAVGLAIQQGGIRVSLDVWHQRDAKRHLSLGEWQAWMDESIDAATHILCLVSTRYRELWSRKRDVQGGFGVAFESIRLIHHLYLLKQHNDGRILTLRPEGSGYDCIPRDLALDCPAYRWSSDRDILLSHVGEAALSVSVASPEATVAAAPLVVPPAAPPAAIRQPVQVAQMPVRAAHRWAAVLPIVGKAALPVRAVPPEVPVAPVPIFVSHAAQPPATRGPTQVAQTPTPAARPRLPWASDSGEDTYGRWADLTVNGATQRMRWIEPSGPDGFWMGEEERYLSREVVADGFWLADTPCTQAFWTAVVGENPSRFKQRADAPERPVECVSWDDVMKRFIPRFADRPGRGTGKLLCLPTEVEWEYAARAGKHTEYWWGDDWDATCGNANVAMKRKKDDPESTTPVKRYAPNPWGLYDVHGNVWEWCSDMWGGRGDPLEEIPDKWIHVLFGLSLHVLRRRQSFRVARGGSWFYYPGAARAANRLKWYRGDASQFVGFRFALRSPSGPEARGVGVGR